LVILRCICNSRRTHQAGCVVRVDRRVKGNVGGCSCRGLRRCPCRWTGVRMAAVPRPLTPLAQFDSISRATSLRHSAHLPTSNKSPAFTAPEKLVIVTSWRHSPHHTLESNLLRMSAGMASHSLAAGAVNVGMDSTGISPSISLTCSGVTHPDLPVYLLQM